MNAREQILSALKHNISNKLSTLPEITQKDIIQYEDLCRQFKNTLTSIGGTVVEFESWEEVLHSIEQNNFFHEYTISTFSPTSELREQLLKMNAHELEKIDRVYITGNCAVAENGAIWVTEEEMIHRLLPFICQHLVLIVERKKIVSTMHDAFETISINGFGSFIAGPSKTADIEQSLVIGAHGARSLTVYLIN